MATTGQHRASIRALPREIEVQSSLRWRKVLNESSLRQERHGELTNPEHHDIIVVEHLKQALNPALVLAVMSAFEAKRRARVETLELLETFPGLIASNRLELDKAR